MGADRPTSASGRLVEDPESEHNHLGGPKDAQLGHSKNTTLYIPNRASYLTKRNVCRELKWSQ